MPSALSQIVEFIRLLVNDPYSDDMILQDEEIEDFLAHNEQEVNYLPLVYVPTVETGGITVYKKYVSMYQTNWADDVKLYDHEYALVTPTTSDYKRGQWTFTVSTPPPLYICGTHYDIYSTAADVLETWAAKEKLNFDFSSDGQSFHRSQKLAQLAGLARCYRAKAQPITCQVVRPDAL
jgi:hypothetical protein